MEENDEIKKDQEALKKYLEQGNSTDDFKKFAEEFAKKAGIEYPKVFSKVVDDETNFKINYPQPNPFGLKSTPARIKSNGVIEVSKKHFLKHSTHYHEYNYRSRTLVIHEISAMDREILQKDITKKRLLECFDYADISSMRLKESEKVLIEKGIIDKKDVLLLPLIDFFKYNLIKLHWKKLGWFGIKQRVKLLLKYKK